MTNFLSALKLTNAKRQAHNTPVIQRRNKLLSKLSEQIGLAKAAVTGERFIVTKLKTIIDAETGERKTVEADKKLKQWFFTNEAGKTCISLRYGAAVIEIAKGKSAVEVANSKELVTTLETIAKAVEAGELDEQIAAVANASKAKFKKQ